MKYYIKALSEWTGPFLLGYLVKQPTVVTKINGTTYHRLKTPLPVGGLGALVRASCS